MGEGLKEMEDGRWVKHSVERWRVRWRADRELSEIEQLALGPKFGQTSLYLFWPYHLSLGALRVHFRAEILGVSSVGGCDQSPHGSPLSMEAVSE